MWRGAWEGWWKWGEGRLPSAAVWLPGLVAESVIRDVFKVRLPSLIAGIRKQARRHRRIGVRAMAKRWQAMLDTGQARNRADLARRLGVSRARVTQVLGPADG